MPFARWLSFFYWGEELFMKSSRSKAEGSGERHAQRRHEAA